MERLNPEAFCHTCRRSFHPLGIASHRLKHLRERTDCRITYAHGDTRLYEYATGGGAIIVSRPAAERTSQRERIAGRGPISGKPDPQLELRRLRAEQARIDQELLQLGMVLDLIDRRRKHLMAKRARNLEHYYTLKS